MQVEDNASDRETMQVMNIGSKEAKLFFFGFPVMIVATVLASVGVGHWLTLRSNIPTEVKVSAAQPKFDINLPQSPAPRVDVTAAVPNIEVHVPNQPIPVVNVQTAQPLVTIMERERDKDKGTTKDKSPESIQPAVVPVSVPVKEKTSSATIAPAPTPVTTQAPKEEEATLDSLYKNAETYVASYCVKNGLNPETENRNWNSRWNSRVEQAIKDGTDSSEQTFINRIVIEKRDSFKMDSVTSDKIVEACRILLRYRDGRLEMLNAMNDALTKENIKKTVVFLAQGAK